MTTKTTKTIPHKIKKHRPVNFYFAVKRAIAAQWSVVLSSDGYANYGTGNVLTSDNTGSNGFGNTNAWCVLSQTINNQQYQFCLQTDGYMGLRVKYSKLGFANGMDNLGITPAAADQEILIGAGTDITPIYQQFTNARLVFGGSLVIISLTTPTNILNFKLQPPMPPKPKPVLLPIINKTLT